VNIPCTPSPCLICQSFTSSSPFCFHRTLLDPFTLSTTLFSITILIRLTKEATGRDDILFPVRKIPPHNRRILATADDPSCIKLQLEYTRVCPRGVQRRGERMRVVVVRTMVMVVMWLGVRCCCGRCGRWCWRGGGGIRSGLRGGVKCLGMLSEVLGDLGLLLGLLCKDLVIDWGGWLLLPLLCLLWLLLLLLLLRWWISVPSLRRLLNDGPSWLAAGGAHSFILIQSL
jgi:hypothetical protein